MAELSYCPGRAPQPVLGERRITVLVDRIHAHRRAVITRASVIDAHQDGAATSARTAKTTTPIPSIGGGPLRHRIMSFVAVAERSLLGASSLPRMVGRRLALSPWGRI
jgi:hypothetical protein